MRAFWVHWRELVLAAAALAGAVGAILLWWRRQRRDPEEAERRRRSYLNQVGRIVEGRILEVIEQSVRERPATRRWSLRKAPAVEGNGQPPRKLVAYSYSISGVSYETAQDVTGMEERACLERVVAGQPASVKYDPANPSNSILIAENWSGLH